jgi:hypothetical protein
MLNTIVVIISVHYLNKTWKRGVRFIGPGGTVPGRVSHSDFHVLTAESVSLDGLATM